MRPFEIGDLVILNNGETGIIFSLATPGIPFIIFNDDLYHFNEDNIKTIRKPRSGGKEARDIVAMLCRKLKHEYTYDYIDAKDFNLTKEYWIDRKKGMLCVKELNTFNKAKQMLENNQ